MSGAISQPSFISSVLKAIQPLTPGLFVLIPRERVRDRKGRMKAICLNTEHYIIPLTLQSKQYASYLFSIG